MRARHPGFDADRCRPRGSGLLSLTDAQEMAVGRACIGLLRGSRKAVRETPAAIDACGLCLQRDHDVLILRVLSEHAIEYI